MSDPPIIITNGSITIEFDESTFKQASGGRFYHPRKKIRRIQIVGGSLDLDQEVLPGDRLTIKIFYSSDNP